MGKSLSFRNNFNIEYRSVTSLNILARAGLDHSNTETEIIHSSTPLCLKEKTSLEKVDIQVEAQIAILP